MMEAIEYFGTPNDESRKRITEQAENLEYVEEFLSDISNHETETEDGTVYVDFERKRAATLTPDTITGHEEIVDPAYRILESDRPEMAHQLETALYLS